MDYTIVLGQAKEIDALNSLIATEKKEYEQIIQNMRHDLNSQIDEKQEAESKYNEVVSVFADLLQELQIGNTG